MPGQCPLPVPTPEPRRTELLYIVQLEVKAVQEPQCAKQLNSQVSPGPAAGLRSPGSSFCYQQARLLSSWDLLLEMANTTLRGAQQVHGTNPQVRR